MARGLAHTLLPAGLPCLQTLAYNAGLYGRAQAMRREGNAPAAVGIADDLPHRFAFEQLNMLSGMASKVGRLWVCQVCVAEGQVET